MLASVTRIRHGALGRFVSPSFGGWPHHSGRLGFHAALVHVALDWLIARPTLTAPIASATSLAQLKELIGAAKLRLDEASMQLLKRASDWTT